MDDYVCNICGKRFVTKSGLSGHNRAVHNTIESTCTVCDKIFRNKKHLGIQKVFDLLLLLEHSRKYEALDSSSTPCAVFNLASDQNNANTKFNWSNA